MPDQVFFPLSSLCLGRSIGCQQESHGCQCGGWLTKWAEMVPWEGILFPCLHCRPQLCTSKGRIDNITPPPPPGLFAFCPNPDLSPSSMVQVLELSTFPLSSSLLQPPAHESALANFTTETLITKPSEHFLFISSLTFLPQ